MAYWYIDALDARAGMGLATYRDADLNDDTVDLGKPAVFIGPPFFQAESVASRAIGFAATRGSFQFGLFSGGEEIAFATLQGICEFIRRVYVSSGGGDTDSGISPAPVVPNPETGGGELPTPPETGGSVARGMLTFVSQISEDIASISQLGLSSSKPTQLDRREGKYRESLLDSLGPLTDVDSLLAYGSAVLIEELLHRTPNSSGNRGAWMKSMMNLGQMLGRLGLLDSVFQGPEFGRLMRLARDNDRRFNLSNHFVREVDSELPVMLGLGPYAPWHTRFGLPFWAGLHASTGAAEPMDDLSTFPIPAVAAKQVSLNPKTASLRDLLSIFLADPTVLDAEKSSPPETPMIVAFALLSSMLIVSAGQASLAQINGTRIGEDLRKDLVRDAIVWMDSQMPGYLFHRDIEKCIRSASQLRYVSRPIENAHAEAIV
jgi:hypothetical protein